jgi:hypothetical protein
MFSSILLLFGCPVYSRYTFPLRGFARRSQIPGVRRISGIIALLLLAGETKLIHLFGDGEFHTVFLVRDTHCTIQRHIGERIRIVFPNAGENAEAIHFTILLLLIIERLIHF